MHKKIALFTLAMLVTNITIPSPMEKSDRDGMIVMGLIGAIMGAWGGAYMATKDLPPQTKESTLKLSRRDTIRIIVYSAVGAITGGLIGATPFLIKWHIDNKEPQNIEELNKKRQKEEAQLVKKFYGSHAKTIEELTPEELTLFHIILDEVKKEKRGQESLFTNTERALVRLHNQLQDQLIEKYKRKEMALKK